MDALWSHFHLFPLGILIGIVGSFMGVGGGFLLVPFLAIFHPELKPEAITTLSLAVVFVNSLSGSVAYARQGRIDYRAGLLFALATLPGAALGAYVISFVPLRAFNLSFGLFLFLAAYLIVKRPGRDGTPAPALKGKGAERTLTDARGEVFSYRTNLRAGMALSVGVGAISSLLGIGGGIIHVPAMTLWLNFPIHIACATSHFVLAIMAGGGTLTHLLAGHFQEPLPTLLLPLVIGVIPGAQIGAALSRHARHGWILRGLALAISVVALRLLVGAFFA